MTAADTARLIASLELQDKFTQTAARAESAMDRLDRKSGLLVGSFARIGDNLGQMGRGIGQVGSGFDKIITRGAIAAAAGLGAIVTTAASFEQSEAGIRKTVSGTTQEVDNLIDSIKQMSRTVPLSFEELAAIAAEGGALGIATNSLTNFTDIVARLGVSTDLTTEQAATALGHMSNVLHLNDQDLRDFGDSLVALGNKGASTESEILDLATRFGAAGKQAGLSNEAILALASTTASMGVEAEAGGGALSRIFQGITLDIGTATEEGQVLADSMGLSLAELRTAWDHDAGKVFGDLLGVISKLDKFQQAEFLSNLGITNVRDINAISLLASGVERYTEDLGTATNQTDELNQESNAFFNTTQGKWETFKNNVRLAADTVGGELLPVVNEVLGDLVTKLSDPNTQASLREFGENLAGGIRDFIGEIKRADFGPLLDVLKTTGSIAKGAFDSFRQLPPEVQALALAAFGINKVTGGALGDISKGLGNIFAGGIKIVWDQFKSRGSSPANPLWVQSVGGIGGGPGGTGGGGFLGFLGAAGAIGAGVAVGLAVGLPIFESSVKPGKDFFTGQVDDIIDSGDTERIRAGVAALDVELAKWAEKPPQVREAMDGVITELKAQRARLAAELPVFGPPIPPFGNTPIGQFNPRNMGGVRQFALPDTAMRPLLDGLAAIEAEIREQNESDEPGNFVPTVKLDPSRINDIRISTAAAARNIERVNETLDLERAVTQSYYAADSARIQRLRDSHQSAVTQLQIIAAKDFAPKFTVQNNVVISATLLEQRLVSAKIAAQGGSATGSQLSPT